MPIIRNGNSKFFGFNETETPETGRIGGRFPQILSAETPASNTDPLPRPCWRSKASTSVRCGIPLKGQKIQTLINFHPGRRMSRVPCQNEGMKMILSLWKRLVQPPQTINQFGSARLVNTAANTRFWAVRRMTRPLPGNGLQCLPRRLCFKRKPPKLRPTLIFYGLSIQPSRLHPAGVKTQF